MKEETAGLPVRTNNPILQKAPDRNELKGKDPTKNM